MSQHHTYSNSGFRGSPVHESANIRGTSSTPIQQAPMQHQMPMRSQYQFEPQASGPRVNHVNYEHNPRAIPYRDHEHVPGTVTDGGGPGNNRSFYDPPTGDLMQVRQSRIVPVDGIRYGQPEVLENAGQSEWFGDLVDLNGQAGHALHEQPAFAGSPRSSSGRAAKPLARTSEGGSEDNISTATTAVNPGRSNEEVYQMLLAVDAKLDKVIESQTATWKRMDKLDEFATSTTTRLLDFRDHVDKKIERSERDAGVAFDDIFDRVCAVQSEVKRVKDVFTGRDPRRTPPNDDTSHDIGAKRRRFDD